MNVAHLLRKYDPAEWGGTETVLHHLCEGLRHDGVRSTVYCPTIPSSCMADPLAAVGCDVRRFRAFLPVLGLSAEQERRMISVGGNLLSFDLPAMLWMQRDLAVVHAHTLGRIGGIGLTIARSRGLPFVVTIHGGVYDLPESVRQNFATASDGVEWGQPFGLLFRARRVLHEADAILTCNAREAALVQQQHPDRRVVVQPHGIPARAYAVDHRAAAYAAFPRLVGRDVVLALGRIDPAKNQHWLLEELSEMCRRHPNLLLVLAGACTDEAYGAALERRIADQGLAPHVLITGKLPPRDPRLIGLLQIARALALPSVSETFGLVILEAWAAETPVVSSRTSGASALIEHGRTGWLFDLDRPASFHEAVDAALADDEPRRAVIAAGRQRVMSSYDTQVIASQVRRLYQQLQEENYAVRSNS